MHNVKNYEGYLETWRVTKPAVRGVRGQGLIASQHAGASAVGRSDAVSVTSGAWRDESTEDWVSGPGESLVSSPVVWVSLHAVSSRQRSRVVSERWVMARLLGSHCTVLRGW